MMDPRRASAVFLALLLLAACKREENAYVPPPPPEVGVARPVAETVTPYLDLTGRQGAERQDALRHRACPL